MGAAIIALTGMILLIGIVKTNAIAMSKLAAAAGRGPLASGGAGAEMGRPLGLTIATWDGLRRASSRER